MQQSFRKRLLRDSFLWLACIYSVYFPPPARLDPIDIVKDPVPPHEYKSEEDPKIFKSAKTARGPLPEDWIKEHKNKPGKYPIMCAYKLCKVEFRYWGMQSKIERFIHDVGESLISGSPP